MPSTSSLCPSCNHDFCYIGLNIIECPNEKCEYFSEKQAWVYISEHEEEARKLLGDETFALLKEYHDWAAFQD